MVLVTVAAALTGQVPYERLVKADTEPGNWLMYSRTYDAQRFSPLDQISVDNVADLQPVWMYQIQDSGQIENTPLVVDDVMYVTEPPARVTALDVHSGRPLWSWSQPMSDDILTIGFGRTNRGVAILDETVFVGTLDAHIVALDAKSGAERWDVAVGDNKLGVSITAAPLAIDDKVIVGISGGEAGVRGYLDAYDAKTGERAWRFWTVPGPDEPGHETWGGDSWKTGGGTTWLTGAYDPEMSLLFWGTGNPAPDWNDDSRPGDNLYTCSLVALDADSGKLRWHFQFTPHDVHDWDANQIPVLLEVEIDGSRRKVVAMANRNGFYYLLGWVSTQPQDVVCGLARATSFESRCQRGGLPASLCAAGPTVFAVPAAGMSGLGRCAKCGSNAPAADLVTAGTILDTRKPLRLWFRAMWHVTSQKHGASALGLQRVP